MIARIDVKDINKEWIYFTCRLVWSIISKLKQFHNFLRFAKKNSTGISEVIWYNLTLDMFKKFLLKQFKYNLKIDFITSEPPWIKFFISMPIDHS